MSSYSGLIPLLGVAPEMSGTNGGQRKQWAFRRNKSRQVTEAEFERLVEKKLTDEETVEHIRVMNEITAMRDGKAIPVDEAESIIAQADLPDFVKAQISGSMRWDLAALVRDEQFMKNGSYKALYSRK